MPPITSPPGFATFINTFRCARADQEEAVRINIDIVEQVASKFPRFIPASVHRSIDGTRVAHDVRLHNPGVKQFHHPVVGELRLSYTGWTSPQTTG